MSAQELHISYADVYAALKGMPLDEARSRAVALVKGLSVSERFRLIYEIGFYATQESVSGPGSEIAVTASIRSALPNLLRVLDVKSVLDAPCGDFNWLSQVDLAGIDYTGVDIVRAVIERNRVRFAQHFEVCDIITGALPRADLILCRDALVHLSNSAVAAALANFRRSGARWLLTTTFRRGHNADIETGQFRPIDLRAKPFSLGEPSLEIDERCMLENGNFSDKSLGLWAL
jgi:SAM-dependent methyltransferase